MELSKRKQEGRSKRINLIVYFLLSLSEAASLNNPLTYLLVSGLFVLSKKYFLGIAWRFFFFSIGLIFLHNDVENNCQKYQSSKNKIAISL